MSVVLLILRVKFYSDKVRLLLIVVLGLVSFIGCGGGGGSEHDVVADQAQAGGNISSVEQTDLDNSASSTLVPEDIEVDSIEVYTVEDALNSGETELTESIASGHVPSGLELDKGTFDVVSLQGVWRRQLIVNSGRIIRGTVQKEGAILNIEATQLRNVTISDVISVVYDNEDISSIDYCDGNGPKIIDVQSKVEGVAENSDTLGDIGFTYVAKYYELEVGKHYRLDFLNNGVLQASSELYKLRDDPGFNAGALTLSTGVDDSLDLIELCGVVATHVVRTSYVTSEAATIEPTVQNRALISLSAPYGATNISIRFEFENVLKAGAYTVTTDIAENNQVVVNLESKEDSSQGLSSVAYTGIGGYVVIDTVNSTAAAGTFDFVAGSGVNFLGTFRLDLN